MLATPAIKRDLRRVDDSAVEMKRDGIRMLADEELDRLRRQLLGMTSATKTLSGVPAADARDAHWVAPQLVAEVEFADWTKGGHLRQASWRGWRPDKLPGEVAPES